MIPYDDLVAALQAWRSRQGLPVNQVGGAPAPGSGPHAKAGSGPNAKPGSGPNRTPPPAPPSASRPAMAVAAIEEAEAEVLDDDAYEPEGNDFAVGFAAGKAPTDAAGAPERPTEADLGSGGGRDDW